jgi:hypothetical protein
MSIFWKIYLLGYLAGFIACINSVKDKDNRISWVELVVSIFTASLSWIIALALFVGQNIKHGHDKKDNDNKDIFGNDNLAGT